MSNQPSALHMVAAASALDSVHPELIGPAPKPLQELRLHDGSRFLALPCAHCRSEDLSVVAWAGDDGEFDGIECNNCLAGAPVSVWNDRAPVSRGA